MSTEITDEQIAELRRLHEAATPGPWESQYARDGHTAREINRQFSGSFVCAVAPRQQVRSHHEGGVFPSADQELIAAARNALPALLARLERAAARIATLEAALRESEDYFDQRADADCVGDPPAYAGNREMTLLCVVRRALRGLEGK